MSCANREHCLDLCNLFFVSLSLKLPGSFLEGQRAEHGDLGLLLLLEVAQDAVCVLLLDPEQRGRRHDWQTKLDSRLELKAIVRGDTDARASLST